MSARATSLTTLREAQAAKQPRHRRVKPKQPALSPIIETSISPLLK